MLCNDIFVLYQYRKGAILEMAAVFDMGRICYVPISKILPTNCMLVS